LLIFINTREDWGCGSYGRALEFNPQHHTKKTKNEQKQKTERKRDSTNSKWQAAERLINVFGRGFYGLHLYVAILNVSWGFHIRQHRRD
jgi:hypothetical protein